MGMPSKTHVVCSLDCPDSCGTLVTIDDAGRATRIEGDPAHPVTARLPVRQGGEVSRSRLLAGPPAVPHAPTRWSYRKQRCSRGANTKPSSALPGDEALSTIAERFAHIAEQHGPESILPYSYAGTIGVLGYGSMDRRFFHRLGASQLERTICAEAGGQALLSVYGRKLGTDTEHFRHARLILAWGANVHGNNIHLWPFIEEARRNGARLIVIDPLPDAYRKARRLAHRHSSGYRLGRLRWG